eukprot:TRINITY_DN9444_c0_g1_i1.p1 TRINITY_DN9444_c0_g1~~TRINITY_DN9444_c0_g1_i1.p1  ORF type:complete len:441 (-),score=139.23 TRINITY_DN9444_c0_g1_i1:187-1509(-)
MTIRRFNTVHIVLFETRNLPTAALRVVARLGPQEVQLADLTEGRLKGSQASATLVAQFGSVETIWLHVYGAALVGDKLLGSCMVYLPSFHIDQTPFEGYLPVTTNEGLLVGRLGVHLYGDFTTQLTVSIVRGICDPGDGVKLGGANEPVVVMQVRDEKFETPAAASCVCPAYDTTFDVRVGLRDRVQFQILDRKLRNEKSGGVEMLGIDLLARAGQYLWVPVVDTAGAKAGKLLLQLQKPNIPERFPIRVLQLNGLEAPILPEDKETDLYVKLVLGSQSFKTTTKGNAGELVWDEGFDLEALPTQALHLTVKSPALLGDKDIAEAFVPVQELMANFGKQMAVNLSNRPAAKPASVLLWVCPPPGTVYPDAFTGRKLPLVPPMAPDGPDGKPRQPLPKPAKSDRKVQIQDGDHPTGPGALATVEWESAHDDSTLDGTAGRR